MDCAWYLVCLDCFQMMLQPLGLAEKGTIMSNIASAQFAPSNSLLSRLMATIDRLLMASARIAIRNGDQPYPGL
jgi:hypothetical protein